MLAEEEAGLQTQLDAAHYLDLDRRACVIDATTAVGQCFNKLFVGYLRREFGADAFQAERVAAPPLATAG